MNADGNGSVADGSVVQKDNSATILNVNYHFTKKSRVYGAYIARDYDTDAEKDDEVRIGLRMDF